MRNIALVLISLLIGLFAIELMSRMLLPDQESPVELSLKGLHQPHPVRGYAMTPNFSCQSSWGETGEVIDIETNAFGFRDEPYVPADLRILVLGDSFSWGGNGLQQDEIYAELLEEQLRSSHGDVTVVNSVHGGYGTIHQYEVLKEYWDRITPQYVILQMYMGNDFSDNVRITEMAVVDGLRVYKSSLGKKGEKVELSWKHRLLVGLIDHSYLARTLYYRVYLRLKQSWAESTQVVEENSPIKNSPKILPLSVQDRSIVETLKVTPVESYREAYQITAETVRKINEFVTGKGATLIVVSIPHPIQVDAARYHRFVSEHQVDVELDLEQPERFLARLAESEGIRYLPMNTTLIEAVDLGKQPYWKTDIHLSKCGNIFLSDMLFKEMKLQENVQ